MMAPAVLAHIQLAWRQFLLLAEVLGAAAELSRVDGEVVVYTGRDWPGVWVMDDPAPPAPHLRVVG